MRKGSEFRRWEVRTQGCPKCPRNRHTKRSRRSGGGEAARASDECVKNFDRTLFFTPWVLTKSVRYLPAPCGTACCGSQLAPELRVGDDVAQVASSSFIHHCARSAPRVARAALVLNFAWFGVLKLVGMSPAAPLIAATFYFLPAKPVILGLGFLEVVIAAMFLLRGPSRWALGLAAFHLMGTFLSFFTATERCFVRVPFVLTTEGEFIVKNAILLAVLLFLAGTRETRE